MFSTPAFFLSQALFCAYNELVSQIQKDLHHYGLQDRVSPMQMVIWANDQRISVKRAIELCAFGWLVLEVGHPGVSASRMAALQSFLTDHPDLINAFAPQDDRRSSWRERSVKEFEGLAAQLPTALQALTLDWATDVLERMAGLNRQISDADRGLGRDTQLGADPRDVALQMAKLSYGGELKRRLTLSSGLNQADHAEHYTAVIHWYVWRLTSGNINNHGVLIYSELQELTGSMVPEPIQLLAIQLMFAHFSSKLKRCWERLEDPSQSDTPQFEPFWSFFENSDEKRNLLQRSLNVSLTSDQRKSLVFKTQILDAMNKVNTLLRGNDLAKLNAIHSRLETAISRIRLTLSLGGSELNVEQAKDYRRAITKMTDLLRQVKDKLK